MKIKYLIIFCLVFNLVLVMRYLNDNQNLKRRLSVSAAESLCEGINWDKSPDDFLTQKQKDDKKRADKGIKIYSNTNKLESILKTSSTKISTSDWKEYVKELIKCAVPWAFFFIVSIFMWIVLCCCVCCHDKNNKNGKYNYSKKQKLIYMILALTLQSAVLASAIAGYVINSELKDGLESSVCSMVKIVTEVIYGSDDKTWLGLTKMLLAINAAKDLTSFHSKFTDMNQTEIDKIGTLTNDALASASSNNESTTKITSTQLVLYKYINGTKNDGEKLTEQPLSIDTADINKLNVDLGKIDKKLDDYADKAKKYIKNYFQLIFNILWGIVIGFSVLGIASILFMGCKKKNWRYLLNVSWCFFCLLMIIGFLLSTFFLPISLFYYNSCQILDGVFNDIVEFNSYPAIIKGNVATKISVCLFDNGDIGKAIFPENSTSYQQYQSFNTTIEGLNNVQTIDEASTIPILDKNNQPDAKTKVLSANTLIDKYKKQINAITTAFKAQSADLLNFGNINCQFVGKSTRKLVASVCTIFFVPIFETSMLIICASFFMFFATIFSYKFSIMVGTKKHKSKPQDSSRN